MLVDLGQGEQGVPPSQSVAVGSLIVGVAQVELQNCLHGYTDGVFLACESKNILPPGLAGAMPSSVRCVRNLCPFFFRHRFRNGTLFFD